MSADTLARINAGIRAGSVCNRDGVELSEPVREALVTDDGKRAYRIDDGIPVLLEDESISMEQLA